MWDNDKFYLFENLITLYWTKSIFEVNNQTLSTANVELRAIMRKIVRGKIKTVDFLHTRTSYLNVLQGQELVD